MTFTMFVVRTPKSRLRTEIRLRTLQGNGGGGGG